MNLDKIANGFSLVGVEPTQGVTVFAVVPLGEGTVQLVYRTPGGALNDRLLNRADEVGVTPATAERLWSFGGDPEAFELTLEAKRINIALLFDPITAGNTSNVEPFPYLGQPTSGCLVLRTKAGRKNNLSNHTLGRMV